MSVLHIQDLHKEFGRITAVDHLNLTINKGSVFGLLGPNGSGKTTTLGMVLGVTLPTSGSFTWFDDGDGHEHRKRIGSILEKPNFYPNFSAVVNLQLACRIKGTPEYRIEEVLHQVGLYDRRHSKFQTFSLGMKQRLAIASALLNDPEVMILDEPTNGLDPQGIADIRSLILEIAKTGKTILLASHLLDEVQKICSEFAILQNGKLIYSGAVDADFGDDTIIHVSAEDLAAIENCISDFPAARSHRRLKDSVEIKCENGTKAADVNRFLSSKGIFADHISVEKKNLEQQFMEILSDHNA